MSPITFSDISLVVIKLTFKSRFLFAKTCRKIPPLAWAANKLFFEGDDIQVLPMDSAVLKNHSIQKIDINSSIPLSNNYTLPSQVIHSMIKMSRYHFIMNFCICRTSNNCKDFPHDLGCLFLGKGAKRISPKFGKLVSADEAIKFVEKCAEAGLVHIIGRNKIDSVWLNTGNKEELLTICNCCNCCCLWKMAPELPNNISNSLRGMEGIELVYNIESCTFCGRCANEMCFVDAITINEGNVYIDSEKCRKCGRCVDVCKTGGLTISIDSDTIKHSVEYVKKLVDVKSE